MVRAPRMCSGRGVAVVVGLMALFGSENHQGAAHPIGVVDPASDPICRTTPGLGRLLIDRHAARAASLGLPSWKAPAAALTGTVPGFAFDLDRIEQGAVVDMGGVIVMVDDNRGIFGTPFNSSGLRLDIVQLAKTYYQARADDVDTLAFFANFNHADGTFHAMVKNSIAGINRDPPINNASIFGSSRLEGVMVFSNLRQKPLDPAARFPTDHNTHLSQLAHEWGHKFGAFILIDDPEASRAKALLGRGEAHWCFFHDTRSAFFPVAMSALEGNRWAQGIDGNWVTQGATDGYSPLDLYLMGLFAPEDVPPFFYIDAPSTSENNCSTSPVSSPPRQPVSIAGPRQVVTIEQVIAFNGPRLPDHTESRKDFRLAMVLLARRGRFPPPADVARLERLRQAWEPYFSVATGGRATMDTSSGLLGPATTFAIVRIPADVQAGHPFGLAVMALDATGRVATDYRGTVRFSSATDPDAVLPGDVTFTPEDRGYVAVPGSVTFSVGGSLSITVTDTAVVQVAGTRSRIAVEGPERTICVPDGLLPVSSSTEPWGGGSSFAGNGGVRFQYLIHRDQVGRPGMITSLNWNVIGGPDRVDWEGVVVSLAHKREFELVSTGVLNPLDQNLADSETVTTVLSGGLQRGGLLDSGRLHLRLVTAFPYNGIDHLLVDVRHAGGVPPGLDTGRLIGGAAVLALRKIGRTNSVERSSETSPICLGIGMLGSPPPTVVGLEVEEVSNTSARIGWRTSPSTIGRVLYGEVGAPLDRSTAFQRFDISHSIQISGLVPGTSYEAISASIDLDNQVVMDGPIAFTTTELRPSIRRVTPETLPQGTPNTLVRVSGENFFEGLTVEIVHAEILPGAMPVPDPTARIVAFDLRSDVALNLGVIIDADAVPGPRRLHLVNNDGFGTVSDLFFGVQAPASAADIDMSGRVDGFDLARLARAFGARFGDARYDLAADLDGDGAIDGLDLTRLADRFGG